ncbi:MAG: PilT/PilU family type 4a pilus ATPase [Planctomycetes bacterium]|nr:PilT/PilU family type 4a pilus ATPase [Planctomycetota bacterium]
MEALAPAKETIEKLLTSMGQLGASDLHLKVRYAPFYRIAGHLRKVDLPPIPDSVYLEAMLIDLVPEPLRERFRTAEDLDFSARGATGDRYRINSFRSTGELHAAIRRVQSRIPTFEELNLPKVYLDTISKCSEGLILISGVTGCGKSSTLAAMIEYINQHRSMHIITIEDPVEYMFTPKKSIISQREIGIDVPDYRDALRFVVRQDPDCILIGEMRDRETMAAALQAAETGHLVFGTLHVADAQQTFSRMLEFFPRQEHAFVRSSLANSLKAIMCQRLLPGIDESKRFPATEVLLTNSVVKDKIVREEDEDIPAIIAQCAEEGMRPFATSLCELIEKELVHYDTAMDYAPNREALASAVKGIKTASQSLVGRLRK